VFPTLWHFLFKTLYHPTQLIRLNRLTLSDNNSLVSRLTIYQATACRTKF